jgi:hypothetical protein
MRVSLFFILIGCLLLITAAVLVSFSQSGMFKTPSTLRIDPVVSTIGPEPALTILPRPIEISIIQQVSNVHVSAPRLVRHASLGSDGLLYVELVFGQGSYTCNVRSFNNATREYDVLSLIHI